MKNSLREKFKTNIFVKPLYKKSKIHDRDNVEKGTIPFSYNRTVNLCGDDFNVKTVISKHGVNKINVKRKIFKESKIVLPGACYSEISSDSLKNIKHVDLSKFISKHGDKYSNTKPEFKNFRTKMLGHSKNSIEEIVNKKQKEHNVNTVDSKVVILHKVPDTWLRIYPAAKVEGESLCSVLLRCFLCQLGLATFLILWTVIAVFTIQAFEGPQEAKVSIEFEKEQNQLVIDLATELRQITPLSPKWRHAIERRIEDERKLTMQAVGNGARLKPGEFWTLPGTFLFTVYVMTALGFGAPVPHTLWGRISALVYAVLAIPTHIYLIVNASTCVVVYLEKYIRHLRRGISGSVGDTKRGPDKTDTCNSNDSRKSENKSYKWKIRSALLSCAAVLGVGRGIPLAAVLYYSLGVVAFGVLRGITAFETFMFPLEFTTTGGLEHVEGHARVLYGAYVEGAVCVLACALAAARRHGAPFARLAHAHRLFQTDGGCEDCVESIMK